MLNERGWNAYCVGKWHLTPGDECDVSSWKGRWPLGREPAQHGDSKAEAVDTSTSHIGFRCAVR